MPGKPPVGTNRSTPGQAYDSSMGGTIAPGSVAVTEDKTTTGGSVGGCGEASLLAVIAPQLPGTSTNPSALGALIQWADNHGLTLAANGDSSPANLIQIALDHFNVIINSFDTLPKGLVGNRQIEVGISRAYELGGWNSNVHGHYITIVGQTADGNYIVSDPNQPESEAGQFIVYSPDQIQRAAPFWYGAASNPPQGGSSSGNNGGNNGNNGGSSGSGFDWGSFFTGILDNIPVVGGIVKAAGWEAGLESMLANVGNWLNPIRIAKLVVGIGLLGFALLALILPSAAGPGLTVAGVVTGQPELVAAGHSIQAARGQRAVRAVGYQQPVPVNVQNPVAVQGPVQVARPQRPRAQQPQQPGNYPAGQGQGPLGASPTRPFPPQPNTLQSTPTVPLRPAPTTGKLAQQQPIAPGNRASLAPTLGPSNPPTPRTTQPLPPINAPYWQAKGPAVTQPLPPPQRAPVTAPLPQRAPPSGLPGRAANPTKPLPYYAAPQTQPLKGPKTVLSSMPMTPTENFLARLGLLNTWRRLKPGQKATGKPTPMNNPSRQQTWQSMDDIMRDLRGE